MSGLRLEIIHGSAQILEQAFGSVADLSSFSRREK
jgi:hypothetical protein